MSIKKTLTSNVKNNFHRSQTQFQTPNFKLLKQFTKKFFFQWPLIIKRNKKTKVGTYCKIN